MTDRLTRATKRQKLTVRDLLRADSGVDEIIDWLVAVRSRRAVRHLIVLSLDKHNRLTIFSDMGRAGENLVLDLAKTIITSSPPDETDLVCAFENAVLDANLESGDDCEEV